MDAKLVIVGGKAGKGPISLKLPAIIGRSRDADLTVAHPMVSRQHCELFEVDGLLKVRDLGSLNGTLVGQEKVKEADLRPQAEFTVGPLTFRVEYEYAGPAAVAAPAEQPQAAAAESPDILTMGAVPDFLATEDTPGDEVAQPQADPTPGGGPATAETPAGSAPVATETPASSAPAETATLDFSALGLDGADQVETEPHPASDAAGQEAVEAPPEPTDEEPEEMTAEPTDEAVPAVNPPALPAAAAEKKKGWWRFGKGKQPPAATSKPAAATKKPVAATKKPAAAKKPAAGKTSPAAKPPAGAPAPAEPAKSPPPSNPAEIPDFLAGAAPGAAGNSKSADPEDDILGFLE
jgi:predicted component of type VI protein secretion system